MNTYLRIIADLGDSAAWLAAVAIAAFICIYTGKAPWWKDVIGRTIVALDFCLLGILIPTLFYLANRAEFVNIYNMVWYKTLSAILTTAVAFISVTRIKVWLSVKHKKMFSEEEDGN